MKDKFLEALQHLGHIYIPHPENDIRDERVRHIARVFIPTGEIRPICGSEGGNSKYLGSPALWLDSNCAQCREIEGNEAPAITKRSLMLNVVNTLCDIEQMFLDAMYWNFHNPDKEPINPDPDGELAKAWLDHRTQLSSMVERFKPTMEKHEGRFAWPTDLT